MNDFYRLPPEEQIDRLTRVALKALSQWGVSGCEPRLIKFRENAVFEVNTADGDRAVLRVHRQGYHSDENLFWELKWMAMLAQAGLVVPQPILTSSGSLFTDEQTDDTPGVWQVDMLTWLDGRELGAVGEALELGDASGDALFRELGRTMANLHNLSAAWPERDAVVRHAWDREGLVGEDPLWGRFWDLAVLTKDQKEFFLTVREAIAEDLDAYGQTTDNFGLIHADLVPENVMLSGDDIQLIDFDDSGFGWHVFEIVTALFWLAEEPDFDAIRASLLDGYQSERRLAPRDIDAMDLFFAARSTTYMGWVHTRQNTETARELAPAIIEIAEAVCGRFLEGRGKKDYGIVIPE